MHYLALTPLGFNVHYHFFTFKQTKNYEYVKKSLPYRDLPFLEKLKTCHTDTSAFGLRKIGPELWMLSTSWSPCPQTCPGRWRETGESVDSEKEGRVEFLKIKNLYLGQMRVVSILFLPSSLVFQAGTVDNLSLIDSDERKTKLALKS